MPVRLRGGGSVLSDIPIKAVSKIYVYSAAKFEDVRIW
jgi:hypothetical protein